MANIINAAGGTQRRMAEMDAMTGDVIPLAPPAAPLPPVVAPPVPVVPLGAVPRKLDPLTGLPLPAAPAIGAVPSAPGAPMAPPPPMGLGSVVKRMFGFGATR